MRHGSLNEQRYFEAINTFGNSCFVLEDLKRLFSLDLSSAKRYLFRWGKEGLIKTVARNIAYSVFKTGTFNVYSFDFFKLESEGQEYAKEYLKREREACLSMGQYKSRMTHETRSNIARIREHFVNDVFTLFDVYQLLEIHPHAARRLLVVAVEHNLLFQIASAEQLIDEADFGDRRPSAVYSFDETKTIIDAVDYYDPEVVPKDEITLDVQLFDDNYKRYLDIRNQKLIHLKEDF